MHQDNLRSVVYRSFVTCDDPKGLAECKTIRKSKSGSKKMESKIENHKIHSSTSTSYEEETKGKVTEELQNLSSFQIMEVSRGAEKLNEVIDSWSNRPNFDKQSNYIAKDLLRGALDLQKSLVMLGKSQEASKYIAKSTKRHKEKPVRGRVDVGMEFMDPNPFGDGNQAMDFQKPRISSDRSRYCYDELRQVIRESFARHNLLQKVCAKEKDHLDRKNSDLCTDFPSSNSSQFSLICTPSSNCSPSSSMQREKPKCPNLITKLMGLEEVPSKTASSITFKQMDKEKRISNQSIHLPDIDLPGRRKPQFMAQKVVQERTLEEMFETTQFKGLLERKYTDGFNDCVCHSDVSLLRKSLAVDGSPIVIMRPLHVPDLQGKGLPENHWINEETEIKSRPKNTWVKIPPSALEVPRGQSKLRETNEKITAGRPPKKKLGEVKEEKHSGDFPSRPVRKTVDNQDRLSTVKINHSKHLVPRMQKKEAVGEKVDDKPKPKVASNSSKLTETKDAKSQGSARTLNPGKDTTLTVSKAVRESNVSKRQIARGRVAAAPDENMKLTYPKSSLPKKNWRKGKPSSKPSPTILEDMKRDDNLPINIERNTDGLSMDGTALEHITEKVMNASYISISDNSTNATSSPCESSKPVSMDDLSVIEDRSCIPHCYFNETKGCKSITNTRHLLLSSVSFLNQVEELLDIGTCEPAMSSPKACFLDSEVLDDSLLLDCAKEILKHKSFCYTRMIGPFSQNLLRKPKCYLSIEELVGEISDGIEDLRNYSKSCDDIILVDRVYSMLERDLRLNEEPIGAWDLGWRIGYTTEVVNEVVHGIEKLVLSEFVVDVVVEYMAW